MDIYSSLTRYLISVDIVIGSNVSRVGPPPLGYTWEWSRLIVDPISFPDHINRGFSLLGIFSNLHFFNEVVELALGLSIVDPKSILMTQQLIKP